MTSKNRTLRLKMLATTATAALLAIPSAAQAQLVNGGDLVSAEDSAGNPGQITVSNPDANTADISVLAPVVVANWNQFNVPTGTTLNVANASAAAQASLLNRVIGGGFSDLGGTINAADVNFWLVNQNGILFGSNTSVNAASFFASTLDLSDADFFDFYEGTNIAGNGSNAVQFATNPAATTILAAPAGASFVTDGTLFFGGPQLDLTGTFDAGSGTASFVAATDVTVNFSAGSPVSYTIPAGTTVASQVVDGSITGNAADFVFQTAAGVMGAMLTVDADVATTAAPTERGVYLYAGGESAASVTVGGALSSTGGIVASVSDDLTLSQNATGSYVDMRSGGALTAQDITATSGDVFLVGEPLVAGDVVAAQDLFFATRTNSGTVTFDSATATDGQVAVNGVVPDAVTITGTTSGNSVQLYALSLLDLGDVSSTAGFAILDTAIGGGSGTISAGNVSATGGLARLTAPDDITTTSISSTAAIDVDSTAGGNLSVGDLNAGTTINLDTSGSVAFGAATAGGAFTIGGTVDPSSITATGNVLAGSVDFDTTGLLTAQTIEANAGAIDIDAGSVSAGVLRATGALTVDAAGPVSLTGAVSDSDGIGGEALAIGATTLPSSLTISGSTSGGSVDLQASGNVNLGSVASSAGTIDIDSTAGNISATLVSASGGSALLTAPGSITTTGISASNAIDIDSTGGGNLNLGNLGAGTTIALDTSGSVAFGAANADGAFTIGGTVDPSSITASGNVLAGSVDFDSSGNVTAQNITSSAGNLTVDSVNGTIAAGLVSASGGDAVLTARGSVTTSGLSSTNAVSARSTNGGALSVGNINAFTSAALNTTGSVTAGSANVGGVYSIGAGNVPNSITLTGAATAGSVSFRSSGLLSVQDVTATAGDINIRAASVTAGALSATDDVFVDATGTVSLASARADSDSSGAGNLAIGTLAVPSTLTITGASQGVTVDLQASGNVSLGSVASSAGNIDIDSTAGNISAALVSASGGDALLTAPGSITTTGISASNAIDVDSTAGGNLSLGTLNAGTTINLDTSGTVAFGAANAGGAFTIGGTVDPSSITASGNVIAGSVDFDSTGALNAQNITATAGGIDIATASINAGAVSATGGTVRLVSPGAITTAAITTVTSGNIDVDSTGGGALDLGNLTSAGDINADTSGTVTANTVSAAGAFAIGDTVRPSSILLTGDATAATMALSADGDITTQDLSGASGKRILADGGSISTGDITTTNNNTLVLIQASGATGDITTGDIANGGSVLVVSAERDIVAGDVTNPAPTGFVAASALFESGGSTTVGDVSTGEDLVVRAGTTFTGGNLIAGDDVDVIANGTISVASATATGTGPDSFRASLSGMPGAVSLISFSAETLPGSNVSLLTTAGDIATGALSATNDVRVDGPGAVTIGAVTADSDMNGDGSLLVGTNTTPTSLMITGDASADSILLMSSGAITTQDLTSNEALTVMTTGGNLSVGDLNAVGNIALDTTGTLQAGTINTDAELLVGSTLTPSSVLFTGNATADTMNIMSVGAITTQNLTTNAALTVETMNADLTTGVVTVLDPGATLTLTANGAGSDVLSTGLRTNGSDIVVTADGDISTGNIATSLMGTPTMGNVSLDAGNDVTTGFASVGGDMTVAAVGDVSLGGGAIVGDLFVGDALNKVASVTLTADLSVNDLDIQTSGALLAEDAMMNPTDITATGSVNLMADTIDVGAITADTMALMSAGFIMTGDLTSNAALSVETINADLTTGAVRVLNPNATLTLTAGGATSSATSTGLTTNGGDITVSAGQNISTGDIATSLMGTPTSGNVTLDATNGNVTTGFASVGGNMTVDAAGAVLMSGATIAGALAIGDPMDKVGSVRFTAGIEAGSVDVQTSGALLAETSGGAPTGITSTAGALNVMAASIDTGAISATGGDATLMATGDVTTTSITSTTGAIDVDSTGGGALDLGTLDAATTIALDTTGAVTAGGITAGGALTVGALAPVASATFTGNVSAASVDIDAVGAVLAREGASTLRNITATAGDIDIDAGSVTAGALAATDDVFVDAGGAVSLASARADSDSSGAGNLVIGATTLPSSLTVTGASQGVAVDLQASGAVQLGTVTSTNGVVDIDSTAGSITTTGVTATGGNALLTAAQNVTATGAIVSTTDTVDIDAVGGAIAATAVTAKTNVLLTAAGNVTTTGKVTATDGLIDVDSTGGGALVLGQALTGDGAALQAGTTIALDTTGAVTAGGITAGGALTVGAVSPVASATFTGNVSAASVDIDAVGAVLAREGASTLRNITATAGDIDIDAGSVTAGALAATDDVFVDAGGAVSLASARADSDGSGAGNLVIGATTLPSSLTVTGASQGVAVDLQASGAVQLGTVTSTNGVVDIDSTAGSITTTGVTATGGNALLTAAQNVTATGAIVSTGRVDIDATGGAIAATAITANGGNVELTARNGVTTTGKVAASAAIDVDSTAGGALTLGQALTGGGAALQAGTTIALDTTGAVTAGGTTAGGALTVGATARPSSVTFTGPVTSNGMTVNTAGTFTSQAAVNANTSASVTARDVAINASFSATDVTLKAGGTGGVALGTEAATFSLSDAELDRVSATRLTIDAGANAVTVSGVSLAAGTGSNRLDVATTGTVHFGGNFTADGAGRTIRFGGGTGSGPASATGVATRITANIDLATIDVGQATLDLRANDIAFGRATFLTDVAGRGSQDLAFLFVGNATSSLYNSTLQAPQDSVRASNPVYLRAGSLSVSYGNSALFQNTGSVGSGATTSDGVVIGSTSGGGTLAIDTLDPNNTFALFGQINNLVGPSAALAGSSVIIVDDTLQTPFSRINGCQIGSGADCLNTTIGTTIISLPRENVNLLSGDAGLLVPFDPLVGTNNEGLFSDAASDDQNLDCPRDARDENGVCVDRQGDN